LTMATCASFAIVLFKSLIVKWWCNHCTCSWHVFDMCFMKFWAVEELFSFVWFIVHVLIIENRCILSLSELTANWSVPVLASSLVSSSFLIWSWWSRFDNAHSNGSS
jgi:hypothetical protein